MICLLLHIRVAGFDVNGLDFIWDRRWESVFYVVMKTASRAIKALKQASKMYLLGKRDLLCGKVRRMSHASQG